MGNALLVARREYLAYITAWGFWVGIIFTPLALLIALGLPAIIEGSQPARYYSVIEQGTEFSDALTAYEADRKAQRALSIVETQAVLKPDLSADDLKAKFEILRKQGQSPEEALRTLFPESPLQLPDDEFIRIVAPERTLDRLLPYLSGEKLAEGPIGERTLYAVFIVTDAGVEYWSDDVVNSQLAGRGTRALERMSQARVFAQAGVDDGLLDRVRDSVLPLVERSPSASDTSGAISFSDRAPFFIAVGFSFLLWLLIFSVVNYLLTGTIEERSNKIFDAILTSISLPQLLTGKLLGVLFLSMTLIGVWATSSAVMSVFLQNAIPPDVASAFGELANPKLLIPTLISFLVGYLMFGSIFLALGSLCDTIQEAQSLMSPIIIVMMIPLLLIPVALGNPESPVLSIMSWVPLLAPFLVILRVPNDPPLWELSLQICWMIVFTLLVIWGASRVYRAGAVHGAGMNEVRGWFGRLLGRGRKSGKAD